MNFPEQLLNRLKSDQQKFALDALTRPHERTTFEYGSRVGVVAGYEAAVNVLLSLLDEEKNSDNDL